MHICMKLLNYDHVCITVCACVGGVHVITVVCFMCQFVTILAVCVDFYYQSVVQVLA